MLGKSGTQVTKMAGRDPGSSPPEGMSDAEVRRKARASIEELGLSPHELDQLLLAANVRADSHQTHAYQL